MVCKATTILVIGFFKHMFMCMFPAHLSIPLPLNSPLQVDNCMHTLEVHHCSLDDEGEYSLTVNNKKTDATLVVERK